MEYRESSKPEIVGVFPYEKFNSLVKISEAIGQWIKKKKLPKNKILQ